MDQLELVLSCGSSKPNKTNGELCNIKTGVVQVESAAGTYLPYKLTINIVYLLVWFLPICFTVGRRLQNILLKLYYSLTLLYLLREIVRILA